MHTMTLDAMVDEIVAALAQQRQMNRQRDQAYIALARAILTDEPYPEEEREASAA